MTDLTRRQQAYQLLEGPKLLSTTLSKVIHYTLIGLILANTIAVIVASEPTMALKHTSFFGLFELVSILVFSMEYVARVWAAAEIDPHRPWLSRFRYLWTPYALIDLAVLLPFYLGQLLGVDLRALRMLRLIRILKFFRYFSGLRVLVSVVKAEAGPLIATLLIIVMMIVLAATGIFVVEHPQQPEAFGSIAEAMWWATVTLTSVGYGDVVPVTWIGKLLASCIMILGVGIVALPAGMMAARFSSELHKRENALLTRAEELSQNGDLSPAELDNLEDLRVELALPRDDLDDIEIELETTRQEDSAICPSCGQSLPARSPVQPE